MFTITVLSMAMALSLSVVVWRVVRDDRRRSEARVHALTDLAVRPDIRASSPAPALSLAPPPQPSAWGTRAAIVACLALVLTTVVLMMLTARTRASMPAPADNAAGATNPARLELLSLRDSREGGMLTIAGLVNNPRGAAPLRDVKVTADLFDASGVLVTSGTTDLDVRSLAPGDQSPFVLSVTTAKRVARYRVSFLNADGRVIQHVDRRGQAPEGSTW